MFIAPSVKRHQFRHIIPLALIATFVAIVGCSTQKNTAGSRWWHSFNAKYNTYYNGAQAYIDGSLEKEKNNKDNYTELIPLYTVGNKKSRELGKNNYNRAIEKAQKSIQRHSIKKRPEWTKNRKKTEKDLEWLNRREYNPFLWKAWMLMGRSQFFKGEFDEAAATFSYMSRIYHSQPAIYGKARAWLAKCYIEEDWLYDAEDIIRNMQRDSLDWRAVKEWDYTYADYYLHTGELEKAVPYLKKVIKHEMRKKQRAREWFLLGQIQKSLGNKQEAYNAFKHVVRQNPPYELEFNARIAMTEVLAEGQYKQMVSRLKRMAASDNNKEYLDQVYYAMGNIYLANKDTANAISAYEKGNEKATRSGIEKGVLLLKLGDLYWQQEKFSDARRCYGAAIGLLDKDRKDYEQLSQRSKVLDELVPFTDAIHLQDSLQALAKMPEAERNAAIDRVIEALKKKEKEEQRKQQEAEVANKLSNNNNEDGGGFDNLKKTPTTNKDNTNGQWYFYNPMAVNQGKADFQRLWGKRENVDNWQRINKSVVDQIGSENPLDNLTDEQRDSIAAAEAVQDSLEQMKDSAQNDPHKREFYLAQIPFKEDQIEASNKILQESLHKAGVIFKDRLDNLPLSEKNLRRVTDQYPDYPQMDDVYYHLFLLYSRKDNPSQAEYYVSKLKESYPESQWTTVLNDPYFIENSKFGEHIEDSLYAATYEAFKADRLSEVNGNTRISATRFPLGANRSKFLFIGGMSKLNSGDIEGCLDDMKEVVEKHPQGRISEMAGMIINGVKAGKRLRGGKFDLENVWNRRTEVLNDSDAIKKAQFTAERDGNFLFNLVYNPDSLSENKLLYEIARFNFSNYLVRNFDINIEDIGGMHQMTTSGFRSFDEAYQYAHDLYNQKNILQLLGKLRGIIISDKNMALIGTSFSYQDYEKFYAKHFVPLKVSQRYLLSEPAEVATPRERDLEEEIQSKAPTKEDIDAQQNDNSFQIETEATAQPSISIPDEIVTPTDTQVTETPSESEISITDTVIPEDKKETPVEQDVFTLPEDKKETPAEQGVFTLPEDKSEPQSSNDFNIIEETTVPVLEQKDAPPAAPAVTEQPKTTVTPSQPKNQIKENPETPKTPVNVPQTEDTGIYFDDFGNGPANTPNQPNNQPKDINIEDEYYELEGF